MMSAGAEQISTCPIGCKPRGGHAWQRMARGSKEADQTLAFVALHSFRACAQNYLPQQLRRRAMDPHPGLFLLFAANPVQHASVAGPEYWMGCS